MKKIFALLLAGLLLLSLSACHSEKPADTTGTVAADPVLPTYDQTENPVTHLSMNLTKENGDSCSLSVVANEDGTAGVLYGGKESKSGDYNASLFHGLATELSKTQLHTFHGQDTIEEGTASGAMTIEFADGTLWQVSFNGSVPEGFANDFAAVEAFLRNVLNTIQESE